MRVLTIVVLAILGVSIGIVVSGVRPPVLRTSIGAIFLMLSVYGATRLFRGARESLARPWWRATAGWKSGVVVSVILVAWSLSLIIDAVDDTGSDSRDASLVSAAGVGMVLVFFVTSTVRIIRAGPEQ